LARVNGQIKSFSSGEISPRLRGRVDVESIYNGCEVQKNFVSQPQGPASFRTGFQKICTTPNNLWGRLVPFVFDEDDSYVLEFTAGRIRAIRDNALVNFVTDAPVMAVEKGVDTYIIHINSTASATTFNTTATVTFSGITASGYEALNGRSWIATAVGVSTFNAAYIQVTIDYDGNTVEAAAAATGFANSNMAFATTFTEDHIKKLQFAQFYDTVFIASGVETVKQLVRGTTPAAWAYSATTFTGTTFSATDEWPSAICIHENRLYLANTVSTNVTATGTGGPTTFWASEPFVYTNFTLGTAADSPFSFGVGSSQEIVWMFSAQDFLVIQTLGGCHKVFGSDRQVGINVTNVNVREVHSIGTIEDYTPLRKNDDLFFLDKTGQKLYRLDYDFNKDRYVPDELTKAAEHITRDGLKGITYQNGKDGIIWAVKEDGQLLGFTYDISANAFAWHRHSIGKDSLEKATVLSAIALPLVPEFNASQDPLYIMVNRKTRSDILDTGITTVELQAPLQEYAREELFLTGEDTYASEQEQFFGDSFERQLRSIHLDRFVFLSGEFGAPSIVMATTSGTGVACTVQTGVNFREFTSADIGRLLIGKVGGQTGAITSLLNYTERNPGLAVITAVASPTSITVDILEPFLNRTLLGDLYESYGGFRQGADYYVQFQTGETVQVDGELEGKTVAVYCDGAFEEYQVITNYTFTFPVDCRVAIYGYEYQGILKTVNLAGGGTIGPSETKTKGVVKAGVQFIDTLGAKVGSDLYRMETVYFRESNALTDFQTPLFTGEKIVHFEDNWLTEKHIYVVQDKGYPCTVQMIVPYMETSND